MQLLGPSNDSYRLYTALFNYYNMAGELLTTLVLLHVDYHGNNDDNSQDEQTHCNTDCYDGGLRKTSLQKQCDKR